MHNLYKTNALKTYFRHYAVNASLAPLYSVEGMHVITVEGVGNHKRGLHPIQEKSEEWVISDASVAYGGVTLLSLCAIKTVCEEAAKAVHKPTKVECLSGLTIKLAALGSEHTLAVTDGGEALSWGAVPSGRLGHGLESSIFGFLTSNRTLSSYVPVVLSARADICPLVLCYPVYFAFENDEIDTVLADIKKNDAIGQPATATTGGSVHSFLA
ncbi:hypothetical protein PVK06_039964 [Gossypium arboreum]|uniref:Uncharacterized protein n=1 Tax=Gossypium arboreum TaxID=29729 RepID=A0ABR0N6D6_GOSAR|nr:hypothetical protein PVK06_039964 [Gossypium arboreum]